MTMAEALISGQIKAGTPRFRHETSLLIECINPVLRHIGKNNWLKGHPKYIILPYVHNPANNHVIIQ